MTTDNDRLRELASALDHPVVEAPVLARALHSLLVFRVGSRVCGTEARYVYEVVVSGPITPVPTARSYVLGITLVRGRLVPVISLGEMLGFPSSDETAPTLPRLLIMREGSLEIAIISDATLGLYDVDVKDLGSSNGARPACIAGEVEFRGKVLFLLDVPELLRSLTDDREGTR